MGDIIMDINNLEKQIKKIEEQIKELPIGSIGIKIIKDKVYYYHRYYQDGKRVEKYIDNSDIRKRV